MKTASIIVSLYLTICPIKAMGQISPYIHQGGIGDTLPQQNDFMNPPLFDGVFPYRPVSDWVGEKLIFLPSPKDNLLDYFYEKQKEHNARIGQICTVKIVTFNENLRIPSLSKWEIIVEMDNTNELLTLASYGGAFDGVALKADIDSARARWLGDTLWYRGCYLETMNSDGVNSLFQIKRFSPLVVKDIVCGYGPPTRFILETYDGKVGYRDIYVSASNWSSLSDEDISESIFVFAFKLADPRKASKWSKSVWQAIEECEIFVGMTTTQVQMSIGIAEDENTTITSTGKSEQWVYPNNVYLYFEGGILKTIQK